MTYTKRQWFIYRLKQCINHLSKITVYIQEVHDYVLSSKYNKGVFKIRMNLDKQLTKLKKLLDLVDSKEVK